MHRALLVFTAALCALAAASCGIPRDPEGTLERVRGGVVRVGVVHDPPWASLGADGQAAGVEPRLVRALAAEIGARVEWVPGGESDLLGALEHHALDWVVDADLRLREEGHVLTGEAFVVPRGDERLTERLAHAAREVHALAWRLYDVSVVPVLSLAPAHGEEERGTRAH